MNQRPVEYDATEQFLLESLMSARTSRQTHRETAGEFTFAVTNLPRAGVRVRVTDTTGAVVHSDVYERVFGLYDVTERIDADLRMAVAQAQTETLTSECNTCPACQTRRETPRPARFADPDELWDAYLDAQDAAANLDCHCDHATCGSLADDHDAQECEWCLHRYDADEDVARER